MCTPKHFAEAMDTQYTPYTKFTPLLKNALNSIKSTTYKITPECGQQLYISYPLAEALYFIGGQARGSCKLLQIQSLCGM